MDGWDDFRLFLAVAETGSFSAAARRLGLGQPTLSRRIASLEERMGHALFDRGAGGAVLTRRGERLVDPARRMAEWASELERAAAGANKPAGIVRVTAPPGVAFELLAPIALAVRARLPKVRLEVVSSVHYVDLVRREADLALRMQKPTNPEVEVLASFDFENAAFAAPSYVATLPKKPKLADVGFIAWAPPMDRVPPNPQLEAMIPSFEPIFASDDFLVQWRAASVGVGAMFLGKVTHPYSITAGLIEIPLPLGEHARGQLHVVAARGALGINRVQAVADVVIRELRRS